MSLQSDGTSLEVPELFCNHEEADTRMLLHAKHISETSIKNIVLHTPDTDVFIITIAASEHINGNLFIRTGRENKARIISIEKVKDNISIKYDLQDVPLVSNALLSLHGFTGCDTVSAFSGKGKVKPMKLMLRNDIYIKLFATFGEKPGVLDYELKQIEGFVCELYGHKEDNVNDVRYKMYSSTHGRLEARSIPPCINSLKLHASRASYQINIWRKCMEQHPEIPTPLEY